MTARRRRQLVVLAELILSPRVLLVLAAIVVLAGLGLWRNLDPGQPCSPGYRMGTTGPLAYAAGPCYDNPAGDKCVPLAGVSPSPSAFALASCVKKGARND